MNRALHTAGYVLGQSWFWLVLGVVSWMFAIGFVFWITHEDTKQSRLELCIAENQSRDTVADILVLARQANRDGAVDPSAEVFYARALERLAPLDCDEVVNNGRRF